MAVETKTLSGLSNSWLKMATTTLCEPAGCYLLDSQILLEEFIAVHKRYLQLGASIEQLRKASEDTKSRRSHSQSHRLIFACAFVTLASVILWRISYFDSTMKSALGIKCVLPNNYLVWEATRPVADCNMCRGVNGVLVLPNVTREQFQEYAYSYRPMLVKGAALNWPAVDTFDFQYFKNLFESTEGAYESVEEECQFLNFKTELHNLKDVFAMEHGRIIQREGEKPWYIGWSNCHPGVLAEMRRHYSKPHFLPADAEHSHVDYIFMGYQQGAFMHLDYISRLMWQAQLRGHKVWTLNPPPECDHVCEGYSFVVQPGDILLLDTRQWYHDTHVYEGEFSLTVSSEYG